MVCQTYAIKSLWCTNHFAKVDGVTGLLQTPVSKSILSLKVKASCSVSFILNWYSSLLGKSEELGFFSQNANLRKPYNLSIVSLLLKALCAYCVVCIWHCWSMPMFMDQCTVLALSADQTIMAQQFSKVDILQNVVTYFQIHF